MDSLIKTKKNRAFGNIHKKVKNVFSQKEPPELLEGLHSCSLPKLGTFDVILLLLSWILSRHQTLPGWKTRLFVFRPKQGIQDVSLICSHNFYYKIN